MSLSLFTKGERKMLERDFQRKLIQKLHKQYPDCLVLKNDPNYMQGIPDLIILYKDKWAALECKRSEAASKRCNQEVYVDKMGKMSFARFIFPENEKEVLDDLSKLFQS